MITLRLWSLGLVAPFIAGRAAGQSGRVITEHGDPPKAAVVERICRGVAVGRTNTDSDGYFRFPEDGGEDCILRARAGSARSIDVDLRRIKDGEVGTIIVHVPRGSTSRLTVSVKALATPESARNAFTKGIHKLQKGEWRNAGKEFEKAVSIYPDFGAAWLQLGLLYERQNDRKHAEEAYSRAVAAEPKMVPAHLRLMTLEVAREDWPAVLGTTEKILAIRPRRIGSAYYYNALANVLLGKVEAAAAALKIARELDPGRQVTKLELIAGAICEKRGDRKGAIDAYRRYLEMSSDESEKAQLVARIQSLEKTSK